MNSSVKTIFVTVQSGPIIQRFLLSDFYKLVRSRDDLRLVLFVEPEYFEFCKNNFAGERCTVIQAPPSRVSFLKVIFRFAAKASLPTKTQRLRTKLWYLNGKAFYKFLGMYFFWILGHVSLWRAFLRAVEHHFFYDDRFWAPYFDEYKPSVVLATALLNERDILLIKHARRRHIPSIGVPRGWDNFSSKLLLRVHPDTLLVFNELMAEEAERYSDFPKKRARIVGFPQFDRYRDPEWFMSKEEVARRIGADPGRRWVSYFTSGIFLTAVVGHDHGDHAETIKLAIERGEIKNSLVVASIYPGRESFFKKALDDVPALRFGSDFYLKPDDQKLFANFIRHSDVILNFGSTISLEAAIFDRPNITLGFNKDEEKVPWQNRLSTSLDHVIHYRQLEETGGVWRVSNEEELIRAVKTYLADSSVHREGRVRLCEKLVGPLDGRAGKRVFEAVADAIGGNVKEVATFLISAEKKAALRTFVASDFLKFAKGRADIQLVMIVPPEEVPEYSRVFAHERCIIEPSPDAQKVECRLKKIFRIIAVSSIPTKTIWLLAKYDLAHQGSRAAFIGKKLCWHLGHFRIWRALIRAAEYHLFREDKVWADCFRKYKPKAVFIPSAITERDVVLMKHARRRGIPVVAMVNGWDNLNAKGSLRVHPTYMLVQNPRMVEDAVALNDFPRERVKVIGFPWFDHYLDPAWRMSREEVALKIGVDPAKKWIGYFTGGAFVMKILRAKDYGDHVLMLKNAALRGEFPDTELVVSIHPGHDVAFREEASGIPVLRFDDKFYFSLEGMKLLLNFIRHCDVTLNFGSTVSLEAAIFDKPIIMVGFNSADDEKLPWERRISVTFDNVVHYRQIQETKGIWKVSSEEELIRAVRTYLQNPSLHSEGRSKIVKEIVGPLGNAAKEVWEALLFAGGLERGKESMEGLKTVFVAAAAGQEVRNILLGDFYKLGKDDPTMRLIVFVPPERLTRYRKDFIHERCLVEPIPSVPIRSPLKRMFRIACFGCIPTRTIWSRIWFSYLAGGSFINFLFKYAFWVLGHWRGWRTFMLFVEYNFFHDDRPWKEYFDRYHPAAVFGAGVLNDEDLTMIKHAKRRGIPTLGMMKSWDNFTSKGFLRVQPDILLVQNAHMVDEAWDINNFPRGRVRVVGFPQLDHYIDPSWFMTKEEVAQEIGADPDKRWVSYFAGGLLTGLLNVADEGDHVRTLNSAVERGEIKNVEIIVGIHPGHKDFVTGALKNPILRLGKGWEFVPHDMRLLMNVLRLSDVTINLGATLSLEASVFDRPIVLVGFNGRDEERVPWHRSLRVALDNTLHYREVESTGGVWRVSDNKELVRAVKTYLENPSLHKEGRARILREFVGPLGGAGKRVYEALKSLMG